LGRYGLALKDTLVPIAGLSPQRGGLLADLREALSVTSFASLAWSEERERAVDRVAASGRASPLGLLLWKARYMLESSAYQSSKDGLRALYVSRYPREEPRLVASVIEQCLHEYLSPFCSTCNGAREMMVQELKMICAACNGSGVRKFSDEERARAMKVSYGLVKRLGHKFNWLLGEMQGLDRDVNKVLAEQLERVLTR
jgi:hypothetical protein